MTNCTNIHGSDNKVAGRDIIHNEHHYYQDNSANKPTRTKSEILEELKQQLKNAKHSLFLNRKDLFLLPSTWALLLSITASIWLLIYFLYRVLTNLQLSSEWVSTSASVATNTHPNPFIMLIPILVIFGVGYWHSKVSEPIFDNIRYLKREIPLIKATIQKIKTHR
jgi:hypothetical protein